MASEANALSPELRERNPTRIARRPAIGPSGAWSMPAVGKPAAFPSGRSLYRVMDATVISMVGPDDIESLGSYVATSPSFESLYAHEYPTLVAMAIALSGSRPDGEDLVQDTMVRTFLHWKRVQNFPNPMAWCVKVLTNLCRDRWRRSRFEQRAWTLLGPPSSATAGPSVEHLAFWDAVRGLPKRWRMAMVLFYAGDRSISEVASILGVPEGTVRSDLSRARQALAKDLER
jgi:RNA polymerase sigma-70 factor, ECF subfamily